jgi:hypothetical protein
VTIIKLFIVALCGIALAASLLALWLAIRTYILVCRSRCDIYGQRIDRHSVIRKTLAIDKLGYLKAGEYHLFCENNLNFCGDFCPYFRLSLKNGITGSSFNCHFQDTEILCPEHYVDMRQPDHPTQTPERNDK